MAFDVGAVVGQLVLDTKPFNDSLRNASQKLTDSGRAAMAMGRQLGHASTTMMMSGTALLAPFALLVKGFSKENAQVARSLESINSAFRDMGKEILPYVVPHLQHLADILTNLAQKFNALPDSIKSFSVNFTITAGVILIAVGTLGFFISRLIFLKGILEVASGAVLGFIAANAAMIGVGVAIGALIFLMFKFKNVADTVCNALEFSFKALDIGVMKIIEGLARSFDWILGLLEGIYAKLAKLPAWMGGNMFAGSIEGIKALRSGTQDFIQTLDLASDALSNDIIGILNGKQGDLAAGFDEIKAKIMGLFDGTGPMLQEQSTAWKNFTDGISKGLNDAYVKLTDFGAMGADIINRMINQMQNSFSNFFYNFFTGQINSLKDAFAEFGHFVLRIIADVIAQLITAWIVKSFVMGGMGLGIFAGIGAFGGYLLAGHADGIESVPENGIYRLHAGEKVVPKYDASKNKETPIIIYNMITPEAVASAMQSKTGEGVIVNVINNNSLRNGVVRQMIQRR